MRTLLLLVLLTGAATAAPEPWLFGPEAGWGPKPQLAGAGSQGVTGKRAAAIVIDPSGHADARAYPSGMVIAPSEAASRDVLVPGSLSLPGRPSTFAGRLLDRLDAGVSAVLELVLPGPRF